MISATISSLALLKARYDLECSDYLETFFPFIIYILTKQNIKSFDQNELQPSLTEEFGLHIPQHTLTLISNRMKKRGYLEKKEGIFHVVQFDGDIAEFEKSRAEAIRHQTVTIRGLQDHAASKLNLTLSEEEALDALYCYIDQYCIECVTAYSCGSIVPVRGKVRAHWRYIVSSYVNEVSQNAPAKFEYFLTTIKGRMLANALLGTDLSQVQMKFRNTRVYLDTPIILQLIGVLGEEAQSLVHEMLRLLANAKANLGVFVHNLDEVKLILKSAERELEYQTGGYGNVIFTLREIGKTPSDITLLRAQLKDTLEQFGIEIKESPQYVKKYQIDETKLEAEMEAAGLFFRHQGAKLADINSVRSIFAVRKGKTPRRVEDSIAILVTNNAAFARAAYSYGMNHEEFKSVSPIITDFSLTNILWLKSPMESIDLPKHLMIANCYAALRPSDKLWSVFLNELKKLENRGAITAEQHLYLRYELRVREELMNLTFGDDTALSDNQIFQILERHEQEIVKPWKDRFEEIKVSQEQASDALEQTTEKLQYFHSAVGKLGTKIEKIVSLVLLLPCLFLFVYAQGWFGDVNIVVQGSPWRKWGPLVAAYAANFLALLNVLFGFKIWNPISLISRACNHWTVKIINRYFTPFNNK